MKAVAIQAFGGPERLAVDDLPDPKPAEGQVLIATEASGVGSVDAMIRSGALAAHGFKEGYVLGNELAGTVTAVGEGVDSALVGKRVWAFTGTGGGYAEQAVAPAQAVIPLPADLSAVEAVSLGSCSTVARFGLRHVHLSSGESVLIRGASGGIGVMAVQLAARMGASVIGVTTSSPERGERLRQLGATHVLDRNAEGTDAPAGYDVILDIVGGEHMPSYFSKLKPRGRFVSVGAVAGFPPIDFGKNIFAAFQKSLTFAAFSAATVSGDERRAFITELFDLVTRGEIKVLVQETFTSPLACAIAFARGGQVDGYISLGESSWDVVAALAILAQLGGESTVDWEAEGLAGKFAMACGTPEFLSVASKFRSTRWNP